MEGTSNSNRDANPISAKETDFVEPKPKTRYSCALCPYSTTILGSSKQHMTTHSVERPFKCPECPYRAKCTKSFTSHVKNVHLLKSPSSRPFPCPESGCSYAAKEKSALKTHLKIHCAEKSFFCSHPNCSYSAKHKESLTVHTRIHTGEKPWVCQFESCSYATAQQSHLVRHTRTHTKERPFKCSEQNCEFSATNNAHLKQHRLIQHPREDENRPSFSCPLCEYSTKYKSDLSRHIKTHTLEKLFKCDEPNCNFEAKTATEIKMHKLVHSDEKPFACSFDSCEFRCKMVQTLKAHLETHSEERRYKCELCPFRAKTRGVVTKHIENVHSDPNLRPFKCREPNCDFASKRKTNLEMHLLIHKGDKKYSCSFSGCEFRAISKYQVNRHFYNIHSDEKREQCRICEYTCKTKFSFTIHMRTHTKEEPYKCKEQGCGYRAKQSSNLASHVKDNHSVSLNFGQCQ